MKRNKKGIVIAVLAICALAAGGAAFTADVSGVPNGPITAGFHQTSISGADAQSVVWNISSDGQYVDSVVMHLTDTDGTTPLPGTDAVNVGFDQTALNGTPSSPDVSIPCTEDLTDQTKWTCTPTHDTVTVQEANLLNVSVTDNHVAKVS
jgi:hypothetical protein